jgi:hypothetical protein
VIKQPYSTGFFPFYEYAARFNIWEYLPMDQGGRLVHLQLIGTEKDDDITQTLRKKSFFKPWGNPIRWDALESTQSEKNFWLNRWYYLPSFARKYFVTGDRSYLVDLLRLFRSWRKANPVPGNLAKYFAGGKSIWRDMQVAWRTQNLIWCYFLGEKGFSKAEKAELYQMIGIHARVLNAYFGAQPLHRNNHQSHGAAAMLFAGILFPDLPLAGVLRGRAMAILDHHLQSAFYGDGNSVELSPGYYPFITSIFRDVFLLCKKNYVEQPKQMRQRLIQFHDYLTAVSQPDGTMPPINDSSECGGSVSLSILRELLELKGTKAVSHYFPKSNQAVMREEGTYVFIDAGPQMLWHWHGGKMGFHLWYGGRPVIVDSGVCNYDEPKRVGWYCTPEAHNTLIVDGAGDYDRAEIAFSKEPVAGCRIVSWESDEKYDLAIMVHDGFGNRANPVRWSRHIILIKGMFVIVVDEINSEGIHDYAWPFHFLPGELRVNRKRKSVRTSCSGPNVLIMPANPDSFDACEIGEGWINRRSKSLRAPVARYRARRSSMVCAFCLFPDSPKEVAKVSVQQTVRGKTILIGAVLRSTSVRVQLPRWEGGTAPLRRNAVVEVSSSPDIQSF